MIDWDSIKFVFRFACHILLGSLLFALVAAVAIGLHRFMGLLLDGVTMSKLPVSATGGVELFVFAADLVCLVALVSKETLVLLREMWFDIYSKT